jgi:hypothetical protein
MHPESGSQSSRPAPEWRRSAHLIGKYTQIRAFPEVSDWVNGLLEKKPFRLVSVALANKLARIAWAVLTRGETYRPYGLPT